MAIDFSDLADGLNETLGDELNARFTALKNGVNVALQWRGAYDDEATYEENDVVTSGGQMWIALGDLAAGTMPEEGDNWTAPALVLGETSSTAYRGDRGKTAYDHSQLSGAGPHGATATPTADKIPVANASGKLDSWISAATTSVAGLIDAAKYAILSRLSIAAGKAFSVLNSITLAAASDGVTLTVPESGTAALRDVANTFVSNQNVSASTTTEHATLNLKTKGATGGDGGAARVFFYDNATQSGQLSLTAYLTGGNRYFGFVAYKDRDGYQLPFQFLTSDASNATAYGLTIGAGTQAGRVGVGTVISPTARLHLPAGTATAGTAPIKLTAGTNLTTPENGAIEFDGSALYITIGGVRKTIQVS